MTTYSTRRLFMRVYILAVVASTVLLEGCAGTFGGLVKAYPGTERPATEVAVIQCGFSLAILAIDGDSSFSGDPLSCKFSLLPGKHVFRVMAGGEHVVEYELKAGQIYTLSAFANERSPGLHIVIGDPVTNKIVTLKEVRFR